MAIKLALAKPTKAVPAGTVPVSHRIEKNTVNPSHRYHDRAQYP
jgi:hypothetical protein